MNDDDPEGEPLAPAIDMLLTRHSLGLRWMVEPGPSRAQLRLAIRAALRAPDHRGLQPWRAVIVAREQRAALAERFAAFALDVGKDEAEIAIERERAFNGPVLVAWVARIATGVSAVPPPAEREREPGPYSAYLDAVARAAGLPLVNVNRATNGAENALQSGPTEESFALENVVSDPVLPMTGEFVFDVPVVAVPGVGLDFSFALGYRSNYAYDGPVGNRWDHNWNVRCKDNGSNTGDVTRFAGNRIDVYDETTTNNFAPPTGVYDKSVTRILRASKPEVRRRSQPGTLQT